MGASSSRESMAAPVLPTARHTATLIFLHGLGDTGHGWAEGFRQLGLKHIKCICPTAPLIPVTLNGGIRMPSWYDILGLSPDSKEDEEGIKKASNSLKSMIDAEVKSGIPLNRIILGGFSQGGAVALYTAFSMETPPAGLLGLSTWMPLHKQIEELEKNGKRDIPTLLCHGVVDPVVPYKWGQMTFNLVQKLTSKSEFKSYHMMHTSDPEEMNDAKYFLENTVFDS